MYIPLCSLILGSNLLLSNNNEKKTIDGIDERIKLLLEKKPHLKVFLTNHKSKLGTKRESQKKGLVNFLLACFFLYRCVHDYQKFYMLESPIWNLCPHKIISCLYGSNIAFLLIQLLIIRKVLFFCINLIEDI